MKLVIIVATFASVATLSRAAHADTFFGIGATAAAGKLLDGAGGIELGYAMAPATYVRSSIAAGQAVDAETAGALVHGTFGVEHQRCRAGGGLCALGGADLGLRYVGESDMTSSSMNPFVDVRVGVDAGGDVLRFRAALDGAAVLSDSSLDPRIGLTLGIAARF